ncbi:MAG: PQQ-binding-like beta-propeller repeat protein, partial [Planctomycetota bacterium]
EEKSFVIALKSESGEEVWRDDRPNGTSWSSPVIWRNEKRTELIVCGSGTVTSYDPASGDVFWKLTGTGGAYSASPTYDAERLYCGQSGRTSRGPLVAIHAGASGALTLDDTGEGKLAWVVDNAGPGMCSPVVAKNRVYVLSRGILSCHDAETGDAIYKERLKNASSVTSSLWASGDSVFAINESGETSVITTGDEFQLTGTNLIEGLFWSSPTATEDALLVRSAAKLYCITKQ